MEDEKRSRRRIKPDSLKAHITIELPLPDGPISLDGEVVDISYSGIKIKLDHSLHRHIEQAELRIKIELPESGVPLYIHGHIRHIDEQGHCGLEYSQPPQEQDIDDLMFECVRHADDSAGSWP